MARRTRSLRGTKPRLTQRQQRGIAALSFLAILLTLLGVAWHVFDTNAGGVAVAALRPIGPNAYAPSSQHATLPHQRVYFVERQAAGYMLMASDVAGAEAPVSLLPDRFGAEDTDVVAALALSPDQRYLAIDAQRDHGDTVWTVATASGKLCTTPADAMGNFLHWLPDGEHFLFRPYLPVGPSTAAWHPGVWIVNAADGSHVNLALPNAMDATDVIDAAPSPDGSKIVLSTTTGLGAGSTVWQATPDGLSVQQLFSSPDDVGLFAWSPDGQQIAYESLAESTVPFRPAGLWLASAGMTQRQQVGDADGGHGFALSWSPDGHHLAFVTRLNASDSAADGQAGAVQSAVSVLDAPTNSIATIAGPQQTGQPRNFNPTWRADGTLVFTAMASGVGYGAALDESSLWQATATPARSTGNTANYTVNALNANFLADASALVAIVP